MFKPCLLGLVSLSAGAKEFVMTGRAVEEETLNYKNSDTTTKLNVKIVYNLF